ncbi:MAG: pyroglutamyl-peptidase I [Proteobacteria bacterium]|nr:pyroglutamyl-peptidase I [Pseudomonadota bacterium]
MSPLVTCFGPFGEVTHNPTVDVTAGFPGRVVVRTALESLEVPVGVSAVVATGLAQKRTVVSVERVAINVADFRIPDVAGAQPRGEPVAADGPDAYLSGVDVRGLADAIAAADIPAKVSNTAGTYVCNAWYYRLLHAGLPAVFLHLPPLEAVPLEQQVQAVRIALGFVSP